jgi:hypothetical protein
MGIASFSPSFFRTPGLSMVLAPVQTVVAFFMPLESPHSRHRQPNSSYAPRLPSMQSRSADGVAGRIPEPATSLPVCRLKVIREFEPGANRSQTGRMVISGRMADVCAELDRIAQKQTPR